MYACIWDALPGDIGAEMYGAIVLYAWAALYCLVHGACLSQLPGSHHTTCTCHSRCLHLPQPLRAAPTTPAPTNPAVPADCAEPEPGDGLRGGHRPAAAGHVPLSMRCAGCSSPVCACAEAQRLFAAARLCDECATLVGSYAAACNNSSTATQHVAY